MSESGSFGSVHSTESLQSLLDWHPLLKGVYPPAPNVEEGLLPDGTTADNLEIPPSGQVTSFKYEIDLHSPDEGAGAVGTSTSVEVISLPDSTPDEDARYPDEPCKRRWLNVFFPMLLIFFGTCVVVTYQLWMAEAHTHKVDNYTLVVFVIFWPAIFYWVATFTCHLLMMKTAVFLPRVSFWLVILTAVMSGCWLLIMIFATGNERVSRDLQGVLAVSLVVFTPVLRWFVLGKGVGFLESACLITTTTGLLVTTLPQVLGGGYTDRHQDNTAHSLSTRVVWSIIYVLGFGFLGCSLLLFEKTVQNARHMSVCVISYIATIQFLTVVTGFWLDFIPATGLADSFQEFWLHMQYTILCSFGQDSSCVSLAPYTWLFTGLLAIFVYIFLAFVYHMGGVLHAMTAVSEVVTLVGIFWSFFVYCDVPLRWDPTMATYTWISMLGFLVLLPPVFVFGYNVQNWRQVFD